MTAHGLAYLPARLGVVEDRFRPLVADRRAGDPAMLPEPGVSAAAASIALPPPKGRSFADVWSALGGELKPSLDLVVCAPTLTGRVHAAAQVDQPPRSGNNLADDEFWRVPMGGTGGWPTREEACGAALQGAGRTGCEAVGGTALVRAGSTPGERADRASRLEARTAPSLARSGPSAREGVDGAAGGRIGGVSRGDVGGAACGGAGGTPGSGAGGPRGDAGGAAHGGAGGTPGRGGGGPRGDACGAARGEAGEAVQDDVGGALRPNPRRARKRSG